MAKKKGNDDPNKLKPEEYSTKQMLSAAKAFLKAAKLCNEPSYKQIGWAHPLIVPIVTNISFACELFLKTLLEINNTLHREHDLLKLFKFLPEEARKNIVGSDDYDDFISKLEQNSGLFEEWRYIYESQVRSIDISFLFDLAERMSCIANQFL